MFRKRAILSRKRTDESGNKGIAGTAVGSVGLKTVLHILYHTLDTAADHGISPDRKYECSAHKIKIRESRDPRIITLYKLESYFLPPFLDLAFLVFLPLLVFFAAVFLLSALSPAAFVPASSLLTVSFLSAAPTDFSSPADASAFSS